jgi:hypothetical protein
LPIIPSAPVVAFVLRPIRFDQFRRNAISKGSMTQAATRTTMLHGVSRTKTAR